ncbi:glycosyltransferase family 4 protein [Salidesulfovibrio onnuriiensis]|uniref:glycosyltransferase family 4 protein n=1 Tax=Salidesulfovibrio onnuriiensis TaxID=2583823 RepID=UPI0011C7282D|nr:glycosyltransferase family 4 protein [Salidesulfovibrio onnuriiensis]
MKKIVLVISSLSMGGAESVLAWLAAGLHGQGLRVTVLTLDDGSVPPFYPLPEAVALRPLGLAGRSPNIVGALLSNWKRIRALRSAIVSESPDVVVSFMEQTNVLTLLAAGRKYPVVVSERVHPMHSVGRLWDWLRRRTYGRAAALVVQTESIGREYGWLRRAFVSVIPNAALAPQPGEPSVRIERPAIVAMGRLHAQKGFDLLLRAFAGLADEYPEWSVVVFGEGRERGLLEALARELGVQGRVSFPGRTSTPHADLSQGDVFVLSSRFEGFPNVLAEAMAAGLPCIAADCPGGPADLITDGKDGLLVRANDVNDLRGALGVLLGDRALRERLASSGRMITERFREEKVLELWIQCFKNAIGARG